MLSTLLAASAFAAGVLGSPIAEPAGKAAPCTANKSLQVALYSAPESVCTNPLPTNFDPTAFKTLEPEGTVNQIFIGKGKITSVLKQFDQPSGGFWALNWRGYLRAHIDGDYTLQVSKTDDIAFFWFGDDAYSGWDADNALLTSAFSNTPSFPGAANITLPGLTAGTYYPMRFLFGQCGGPYNIVANLYDPNGMLIWGGTQPAVTGSLWSQGCSAADNAPAYPPFGQET